ncbi:uncharacterized protein LOC129570626 [Sitodiplosis mosellana]|uniref:uncharacterized protein LOC129570626 n=1 Tax=Sitodiplosis mosellana TaxID=263140 RepID=UPI002443E877|nr:uncharacterized protein LOC129570626 [Sitodiplosis mosellana]
MRVTVRSSSSSHLKKYLFAHCSLHNTQSPNNLSFVIKMIQRKFSFFLIQSLTFVLINAASPNVNKFHVAKRDVDSKVIDTQFRIRRDVNLPSSNEEDLNSIKQAIYETSAVQNCDFKDFKLNLVLKKLHQKRRNGDPRKQDPDIVLERHCYVVNNSTKEQELQGNISVSKNYTGTNMIRIEKTKGFTVNADNQIDIPFIISKVQIGAEFGQNDTFTKNINRFTNINSGDIKTSVPAFSKMKVSLYVYENVDVHNFLLDFELDEYSSISCASDNAKKLREFLPIGQYGSKTLQLEHINGTFLIKNIPASETIVSFGIRTKFGTEEKI